MENFIVSARKYRPVTFETVVGQQHITGTLKNAIKNNQLAQAFLFCGPRGVGKTTCARILAKTINCTQLTEGQEACGTCESCQSFQSGNSFNFHELDAASNNSVDDIRSLIEQVRIPPQAGKYKIYIIDEVHMLSASAFNAFLKTLEEPPPYAIFILATTEKHKILPTILSRCQIFDFNRIQVEDIANHLAKIAEREDISVDYDGLHIIAQKADGGLRDALSMFDQIVSYTNKQVTYQSVIANLNILDYDYYFKLTDYLTKGEVSNTLLLFNEILNNGFDGHNFINGLAGHFRNLLVGKDNQTIQLLEVSENIKQKYLTQSNTTPLGFILTALNLANQCDLEYKNSKNQRLQVELALIKMCHIPSVIQLANTSSPHPPKDKKKTLVSSDKAAPENEKNTDRTSIPASVSTPPTIKETEITNSLPTEEKSTIIPQTAVPLSAAASTIKIQPERAPSPLVPLLTDLDAPLELKEQEPEYIKGSGKENFSEEQFMHYWQQYAQKAKETNKIHLYTLLSGNKPIIEGTNITVLTENLAIESTLQEEKIEILNFLRQNLQNFDIQLASKRIESKQTNRIYTNKDKYAYLLEKNPQLEELRKRFNLDLLP